MSRRNEGNEANDGNSREKNRKSDRGKAKAVGRKKTECKRKYKVKLIEKQRKLYKKGQKLRIKRNMLQSNVEEVHKHCLGGN